MDLSQRYHRNLFTDMLITRFTFIGFLVIAKRHGASSNILENDFEVVPDMSPTGEPYHISVCRPTLECAVSCAKDHNCTMSTAEHTDSRHVDCQLYSYDSTNTASKSGVKLFIKKGKNLDFM